MPRHRNEEGRAPHQREQGHTDRRDRRRPLERDPDGARGFHQHQRTDDQRRQPRVRCVVGGESRRPHGPHERIVHHLHEPDEARHRPRGGGMSDEHERRERRRHARWTQPRARAIRAEPHGRSGTSYLPDVGATSAANTTSVSGTRRPPEGRGSGAQFLPWPALGTVPILGGAGLLADSESRAGRFCGYARAAYPLLKHQP